MTDFNYVRRKQKDDESIQVCRIHWEKDRPVIDGILCDVIFCYQCKYAQDDPRNHSKLKSFYCTLYDFHFLDNSDFCSRGKKSNVKAEAEGNLV